MRFVLSIDWDFFIGSCDYGKSRKYQLCLICGWKCFKSRYRMPVLSINERVALREELNGRKLVKRYHNYKHPFSVTSPSSVFFGFDLGRLRNSLFYVADCHASIYRLLNVGDVVFNVDAHNDYNDDVSYVACSNWGRIATNRKHIWYKWSLRTKRKSGFIKLTDVCDTNVDVVFMCLSMPYTDPLYDDYFYRAVKQMSEFTTSEPRFVGIGADHLRRRFRKKNAA